MKHTYTIIYIIVVTLIMFVNSVSAQSHKKEAINLGLSVKWANMNVGANAPEEYGDYYAWGEVKSKRYYGAYSTYKHYDDQSYHKYNYKEIKGSVKDNLFMLKSSDDVASKHWGDKWRMPTAEEIMELINQCIWTYTEKNGSRGYWIKNKESESDSIFLPMVGYRDFGTYRFRAGTEGCYWSSSLLPLSEQTMIDSIAESRVDSSMCLRILEKGIPELIYSPRPIGCVIRPVLNKK